LNSIAWAEPADLDLAVNKTVRLREHLNRQFRTELFNSLNHPNISIPSQRTVFSSAGAVGSAKLITKTRTSSRQLQFGLKLTFCYQNKKMIPHRTQTGFQLRAALAMLLLLFGAMAPSARMWLPEPVTCGMVCCEESGVCYCQTHHTGDSEATGTSENAGVHVAKLNEVNIGRSCPAQCAQLSAGFKKQSIARGQPLRLAFVAGAARRPFNHTPFLPRDILMVEAHAPRAPPIILL
jgi:hypothetical protein